MAKVVNQAQADMMLQSDREDRARRNVIVQNTIDDLDSTALLERMSADIDAGFSGRKDRALRDRMRMGANPLSAIQTQELNKTSLRSRELNRAGVMNKAYRQQYDRNTSLRDRLINIGRGVHEQAVSGEITAANNTANRARADSAADAADKAATMQTFGTVAGIAPMFI